MPHDNHDISVTAILANHIDVSNALRELQRTGCDLTRISVVGKDAHTEGRAVGYYTLRHHVHYWGTLGAFWGGLWSLLDGSAFFVIPGIGQVLIAGPLVAATVTSMEGDLSTPPLSALGAGLHQCRIPKDRIGNYETAVRGTKFLLCAHGPSQESALASTVLKRMGHEVHDLSVKGPVAVVEETPRVYVIEVT
jgi:hypothetical protein